MADKQSQTHHYFIDEGGDSTLFSRKGKVLIGTEGLFPLFHGLVCWKCLTLRPYTLH